MEDEPNKTQLDSATDRPSVLKLIVAATEPLRQKPMGKDHKTGGKSDWMEGFFARPAPPLWKVLKD